MARTRRVFVLEYMINGSKFKREYLDQKERDDRADLYVTNGITVVSKSRLSKPGEVLYTPAFAHG